MRRLIAVLVAAIFIGWSPVVWAGCPDGKVLKKIGNTQTDDANITTQGQDVMALSVLCTGTACVAGFYNTDSTVVVAADLVFEAGAAASALAGVNGLIDLTDSPLYFSEGVTFIDNGDVQAVTLYSCQQK